LPLGFRWRRNNVNVPNPRLTFTTNFAAGEVLCVLTVTNVQTSVTGRFDVVITNQVNPTPGILSATAQLLLASAAPVITSQPTNQTVVSGNSVTFTVAATGGPLFYQWRFNGTNLIGQTNATLVLPNIQTTQAGQYSVLVSNTGGSTPSQTALLTVLTRPSLRDLRLLAGQTAAMNLLGDVNQSYVVEYSTNLSNWTALGTVLATSPSTPVTDSNAVDRVRFYRARLP
jgi:hypothetical protein